MSLLNGLIILLLFQYLGELIKNGFNLVLPGPVIGMLLLFFACCLYRDVPPAIATASRHLIQHLVLMFLPAAAGIFFLGPQFTHQFPAIIAAIVIGTVLSLTFNGLVMKWLSRKSNTDQHPG